MIKVFFEYKGYAEHVRTYATEKEYMENLMALEILCESLGFERITETIE